jgi:3-oxoacyl-[acyl-carrier protein] reductase
VFLAGRTSTTLEEVAEAIHATGGAAEAAEVDALDEEAVDRHADAVAAEARGIDISFNLITHPHTHGTRLPRWPSTTSWRRWRRPRGRHS